jgi:two-component system, NarL family, nitrate/nitrite response regulator NarL
MMTTTAVARIRVVVVEDHGIVLWGLKRLLENAAPEVEVVGCASTLEGALGAARSQRPDVILLDIRLGERNALDILPRLLGESGGRVLVITGDTDEGLHRRALLSGASGVVTKDAPAEVIVTALRRVHSGELWGGRSVAPALLAEVARERETRDDHEEQKIASLTPKEREIVSVIASEGDTTSKHLARLLNISENTLRNHLASIYDKLEVGNRLELFKYALAHGIA